MNPVTRVGSAEGADMVFVTIGAGVAELVLVLVMLWQSGAELDSANWIWR